MCLFQMHDTIAEERQSDDEMEWKVTSKCSDVEMMLHYSMNGSLRKIDYIVGRELNTRSRSSLVSLL